MPDRHMQPPGPGGGPGMPGMPGPGNEIEMLRQEVAELRRMVEALSLNRGPGGPGGMSPDGFSSGMPPR